MINFSVKFTNHGFMKFEMLAVKFWTQRKRSYLS